MACIAEGAKRRTRPRLGQSGWQTGQQYWMGKECKEKPPTADFVFAGQATPPRSAIDGEESDTNQLQAQG